MAALYIFFWLTLGLLVWLINWRVLTGYIASDSATVADKFNFYLSGYTSLVTNYSIVSAAILIVFAVLTATNGALLYYVISKSLREALASGTRNAGSLVAALIGAGCAACGTSFLAPLLTGVSGAASITLTMAIGVIANIVGLALLSYSIFRLGSTAAGYAAKGL